NWDFSWSPRYASSSSFLLLVRRSAMVTTRDKDLDLSDYIWGAVGVQRGAYCSSGLTLQDICRKRQLGTIIAPT
ncbi:hypothetical protein L9F63_011284, partial [Diploptera punctata]